MRQFLLIIVFLPTLTLFSQKPDRDPNQPGNSRAAKGFFQYQNFKDAMTEYENLLKKDSGNVTYKHNLAICYLNTNIDRSKAIPLLEWVTKQAKCDPNAWYDLGRAYAYENRFEDAIKAYQAFINLGIKDMNPVPAKRQIEMCKTAIEMIKSPVDVTINMLSADINSPSPDINPYIAPDESYLIFSTKRQGNNGNFVDYDGYMTSDIYWAPQTDGVYKKAKGISNTINSYLVEESCGMSGDGEYLFVFMDNEMGSGDLAVSERKGKSYARPELLSGFINDKSFESAACIFPNKKTIIFSSNRSGGKGGMDLYISRQLPNGDWGTPENLGALINTQYDEDFPYLAPDGESFYFASTGHNSMGGYDIFKCKLDKKSMSFSKPTNLGYPVNNCDDNTVISFTQSGRHAYSSYYQKNGIGCTDIYRITFNNVKPKECVISGKILASDSSSLYVKFKENTNLLKQKKHEMDSVLNTFSNKKDTASLEYYVPGLKDEVLSLIKLTQKIPQVSIKVTNLNNGKLYGLYRPNKNSGQYIIIVEPGDYKLLVECPGYQSFEKIYKFNDDESSSNKENQHIILQSE